MTQCLWSELAEALFYFLFILFFLLRNVAVLLCETLSEFGPQKKKVCGCQQTSHTLAVKYHPE